VLVIEPAFADAVVLLAVALENGPLEGTAGPRQNPRQNDAAPLPSKTTALLPANSPTGNVDHVGLKKFASRPALETACAAETSPDPKGRSAAGAGCWRVRLRKLPKLVRCDSPRKKLLRAENHCTHFGHQ